jgi:hypothetical protein
VFVDLLRAERERGGVVNRVYDYMAIMDGGAWRDIKIKWGSLLFVTLLLYSTVLRD